MDRWGWDHHNKSRRTRGNTTLSKSVIKHNLHDITRSLPIPIHCHLLSTLALYTPSTSVQLYRIRVIHRASRLNFFINLKLFLLISLILGKIRLIHQFHVDIKLVGFNFIYLRILYSRHDITVLVKLSRSKLYSGYFCRKAFIKNVLTFHQLYESPNFTRKK